MTDNFLDFEAFGNEDLAPPAPRDLPKGDYVATLQEVKLEEKENGAQLLFIWTQFTDTEGNPEVDGMNVTNRKLFQREWIHHSNETAQRIGRQRLTQIAKAFGLAVEAVTPDGKTGWVMPQVSSTEELAVLFGEHVGRAVGMFVNRKKRRDRDEMESVVGSVSALAG